MLVLSMFQAALALEVFYFFLFYFPSVTIYQALVSRINPSNSLATTTTTTPAPVAKISDGCAVYLNSSSAGGTIQSVNYPSDYDPNLDCTYTFEAPTSDYTVQLTFTDFSVESCCDSFSVSDGTNLIQAGITGYSFPGPFTTSSNQMVVKFKTNKDNSLIPASSTPGRWQATYTFIANSG